MRISDWSSDVCSSDLFGSWEPLLLALFLHLLEDFGHLGARLVELSVVDSLDHREQQILFLALMSLKGDRRDHRAGEVVLAVVEQLARHEQAILPIEGRFTSAEHTSELQSLMRILYAVFSSKKTDTYS